MPTPTEFIGEFQVNTGTANTPNTLDPHIIGLSNGNFLVAWAESGTTGVATESGFDVVGKIFDAEGALVRDTFRLNTISTGDDEDDFDIAATNDGGFVLVYREDETATQTDLNFQRHSASGDVTVSSLIVTETIVADDLSNPQISFDQMSGTSLITYTADIAGNEDLFGISVDSTASVVSGPYQAARNFNPDDDRDGDVAVLDTGDVVSVYEEIDGSDTSIEFHIYSPTGAVVASAVTVTNGGTDLDPQVTALAGGGFVVTWEANDTQNGDIQYRIYDGNGVSVAGAFTSSGAPGANAQNEPEIVALPDGDFVIIWDDDTNNTMVGQRFDGSDGGLDGDQFVIEAANTTTPNIGVTSDGRLLFTWSFAGNVWASIWDPRATTINGDDYNLGDRNFVDTNVFTSLVTSSNVNGTSANDTILGQDGDDFLNGAAGNDTVFGGNGNDTFTDDQVAQAGEADSYDGGNGTDTLLYTQDLSDTYAIDLNTGQQTVSNGTVVRDTFSSIENVIVAGAERVVGNAANNVIIGTGFLSENVFDGGLGNDTLNGGGGDDELNGGQGDDTLYGDAGDDSIEGGSGLDVLFGGSDNDIVEGKSGNDMIFGGSGADRLKGHSGKDTIYGDQDADTILGGESDDTLFGGDGEDALFGGRGRDEVVGGAGADDLFGNEGNDLLRGGDGNDVISGGDSKDEIYGGGNDDTITGGNNVDNIRGQSGDDTIKGNRGNDVIRGGSGDDFIRGNDGRDTILGGDDNDDLRGGTGDDTVFGGNGDDTLLGGTGNDVLSGGAGNDVMTGGDQADFFEFRAGDDLVSITDFENNSDTIRIEAALNAADLSNGAFLAEFGEIIDGNAVLVFGSDGTLIVEGVSTLGLIGNDLEFI